MRSTAALLLFAAVRLSAIGFCTNPGGPTTFQDDGVSIDCFADTMFTGGQPFVQASMGTGTLGTLRYPATGALSFSYTIPTASTAPAGLVVIQLTFVEPNITAVGGRVFNVTVNGQRTPNIDLVALTGGPLKPYVLRLLTISYGQVRIDFNTVTRNAIVNEIRVDAAHPLDVFARADVAPLLESTYRLLTQAGTCVKPHPTSTGFLCPVDGVFSDTILQLWDSYSRAPGPTCMLIEFANDTLDPIIIYDWHPECAQGSGWWAIKAGGLGQDNVQLQPNN